MPPNFGDMLDIARRLAADFEVVRVDMYNVDGRIYVGELTNYPQAGIAPFEPTGTDPQLRYRDRSKMTYLPLARRFLHRGFAKPQPSDS